MDVHLTDMFAWFGREGVVCGCYLAATFAWFGREGVLCGCSLSCYVCLVWEGRSVVWMFT